MKKIIFALMLCMMTLLQGCGNTPTSGDVTDSEYVAGTIREIIVESFPPRFETFSITDAESIRGIVEYLNTLNLDGRGTLGLDLENYQGGGYTLDFTYKDDAAETISIMSNKYLVTGGGIWALPYDEAAALDNAIGEILIGRFMQSGAQTISGKIVSVVSEDSGRDISCDVKTANGDIVTVNVLDSYIFDITSNGWMILHEDDDVEIFFSGTDSNTADIVFITAQQIHE